MQLSHPFPPEYDSHSRLLIIGSFPSVKSREEGFYYAHPRNRFWKMLEIIYGCSLSTVDEKKRMLHEKHIALWDAVSSCSLSGSADSSIRDVIANDIATLIGKTEIRKVLANGSLAARIYEKHIFPQSGIGCIPLPSTSPANAAFSLERLCEIWSQELLI